MRNPWLELPRKPDYVLEIDAPHIEAVNRHAKPEHRLDLRMIPVPFLGNRAAPLVVLGLNPSYQPDSLDVETGTAPLAEALRANLGSDPRGHVHPGLASKFAHTGGGRWWRKCLKALIELGHDPDDLARRVLAVDFHGYRSKSWQAIPLTLPSQHYGFHLVGAAIDRGATIVVTRGVRHWEVAVPRLFGYRSLVLVKNVRSATVSTRNCGEEEFARVRKALT